jgi:uncharacterized protein YndB with AHSA1/START domain
MGKAETDLSNDLEIRTSRVFDAPRELVWSALTDPAHVDAWWGPDGFTNITAKHDFRAGGSWVFTMRGPDGKDYPNAITYREIKPFERLAYRHGSSERENPGEDFNTVILLEDLGGKTRLTMRATFKDKARRDFVIREYGAVEGARQHLEKLADQLERMQGERTGKTDILVITRTLEAPRELVWKAFTEPERMARWWGPPGSNVGRYTMDFRPGGRYHFSLTFPQGGEMWGLFVYQEISPIERLVYHHSFSNAEGNIAASPFGGAWPARILSTLEFVENGSSTEVTLRWSPLEATSEEEAAFSALIGDMTNGWGGTLDRLATYLGEKAA